MAQFLLPAAVAVVGAVLLAPRLNDRVITSAEVPAFTWRDFGTFWVNPVRHPSYGWAWWSRLLIFFGIAAVQAYQAFYLIIALGYSPQNVSGAVFLSTLVLTVFALVFAPIAGKISDRIGRRKPFVVVAALIFAVGLVVVTFAHDYSMFLVAMGIIGLGQGVYMAVDLALVSEILPDQNNIAKDMGHHGARLDAAVVDRPGDRARTSGDRGDGGEPAELPRPVPHRRDRGPDRRGADPAHSRDQMTRHTPARTSGCAEIWCTSSRSASARPQPRPASARRPGSTAGRVRARRWMADGQQAGAVPDAAAGAVVRADHSGRSGRGIRRLPAQRRGAHHPAQCDDVAAAVAWLRAHAGEWGVDPSRMVLWANPPRATLAALTALADPEVRGVVDWYGPADLPALARSLGQLGDGATREAGWLGHPISDRPQAIMHAREASPVTHVHDGAPPFHIAHGLADAAVPPAQSTALAAALEAGVPVELTLVPGAGHMAASIDRAIAFCVRVTR